MKIRVIEPFRDVAFDNQITRKVGDIIDTTNPEFKCSEDLAMERIRRGFCEEVKDEEVATATSVTKKTDVPETKGIEVETKVVKKGKKVSKKK